MPSQFRLDAIAKLISLGIPGDHTLCFLPLDSELIPDTFFRGIGSVEEFYEHQMSLIRSVCLSYAKKGVTFTTLDGVIISPDAVIGKGTQIGVGVQIKPGCVIGEGCVIEAGSVLSECRIEDGCIINASQITGSTLHRGVTLGPYSQIRPGCEIGEGCRIGDFVEIKNATLGKGTKVAHLTYIGDADVGSGVNFGCGTVISNYDGKHKFRTTIGDRAFIGCNTNLIAPVTIEEGAYTAAGSTITQAVPSGALAIARSRQSNVEGWVERKFGKEDH